MKHTSWPVDFRLLYPEGCTPKEARELLAGWSRHWRGWGAFPWRCTRNIHRYVNDLPVRFQSVMVHQWVCGQSSWLVLNGEFEDRNAVLEMMARESFQLFGLHRAMLVDALRYEMRFNRREYILDCSGPEDGHDHHTPEEIAGRRKAFRECIEGACVDTMRIVSVAAQTSNLDEWMLGRRLRSWARGGDMPDPIAVPVRQERRNGKSVILPVEEEAKAMVRAGKKVPRIDACPWTGDARPAGAGEEGAGSVGRGQWAALRRGSGQVSRRPTTMGCGRARPRR